MLWTLKQLHEIPALMENDIVCLEDQFSLIRDKISGTEESVINDTLAVLRAHFERL